MAATEAEQRRGPGGEEGFGKVKRLAFDEGRRVSGQVPAHTDSAGDLWVGQAKHNGMVGGTRGGRRGTRERLVRHEALDRTLAAPRALACLL